MGQGDGGLGAELHVEKNDKDGQEDEIDRSEERDPKTVWLVCLAVLPGWAFLDIHAYASVGDGTGSSV